MYAYRAIVFNFVSRAHCNCKFRGTKIASAVCIPFCRNVVWLLRLSFCRCFYRLACCGLRIYSVRCVFPTLSGVIMIANVLMRYFVLCLSPPPPPPPSPTSPSLSLSLPQSASLRQSKRFNGSAAKAKCDKSASHGRAR